jgi:hypothetical protein
VQSIDPLHILEYQGFNINNNNEKTGILKVVTDDEKSEKNPWRGFFL